MRIIRTLLCGTGALLCVFFVLFGLPDASAQNVLTILAGDDDDPTLKQQGIVSMETVKQRLKEITKLIERPEGPKKQAALNKELKALREQLAKYQVPPKERRFRRDKELVSKREEIGDQIRKLSSVLLKMQTAYGSIDQHHLDLRTVLKIYADTRKQLKKSIEKKYSVKKRKALFRLIKRAERRLKREAKAMDKLSGEPTRLDAAISQNKRDLKSVREKMLRVPVLRVRPRPRPRVAPRPKPTPKRRRRRRRRAKKPAGPPPLTPAQLRKIERKRERDQYLERLNSTIQRFQFRHLSQNAIYLRVRKRDVKLEIEVHQFYASLYKYTIKQMRDVYDLFKAKAAGGRLHHQPIQFSSSMFSKVSTISTDFLENSHKHAGSIYNTASTKIGEYNKKSGLIFLILYLLFPFLLIGLAFYIRVWLRRFADKCTARIEENEEEQQFWRVLLLSLDLTRRLLVLTSIFLGLWLVIEVFQLPEQWNLLVWNIGWTIISLRAIWILADQLLAEDSSERVLKIFDDELTRRFRSTIKWLSGYAVIYLPFLELVQVLKYPEPFYRLLDVSFYTVIWFGAIISYMRSPRKPALDVEDDDIEIEEPADVQEEKKMRRWSRILGYRVYPFMLLVATAIFGTYAWGYQNLATYLARACLLTVFFISITSSLYQGLKALVYWLFSLTKKGKGLVQVSERTGTIIKRSSRIVLGTILGFFTLSLIMQAWQVPGGYQAVIKLLNYPILQVKGARLSVLSIVKFILVFGASVWLSGYIKKKLNEKVYPVFHMTPGTQHATNTIVSYVVIIVGVLAGLQVMGMSIGVLAVFAGVVGIGVGFGLQNIASNFISGLIITFGRPVAVGDVIEVGDVLGVVRAISARSMTVETNDSRIVLVPNAQIITSQVINLSLGPPHVFIKMGVGVAYGSDVKLVEQALLEVAKGSPHTLNHPPPIVQFMEFNSSSLDFVVKVAIRDPMAKDNILSALRFATDAKFAELEIEMPFPQQDLHLDQDVAETFRRVSNFLEEKSGGVVESPVGLTPPTKEATKTEKAASAPAPKAAPKDEPTAPKATTPAKDTPKA